MRKIAKIIICSLLIASIINPIPVEAKSTSRPSSRISSHRSNTKIKSSSPKIVKTKKATKTYRTTSSIRKKPTLKKQEVKKLTTKQIVKNDRKITTHNYYSSYNPNRYYNSSSNSLSFWDYYMLGHLFNNNKNVSEQDIARELQKQGYSKQETDNILNKANQNQIKKKEKKKRIVTLVLSILIIFFIIGLSIMLFIKMKRRKENEI